MADDRTDTEKTPGEEAPDGRPADEDPRARLIREKAILYAPQLGCVALVALLLWGATAALVAIRGGVGQKVLTGEDFGIRAYVSDRDADGDGTDDQTDILQSARDYVATRPAYRSTYYEGGWPTDGTGVCTDVVAYALLGAGYDLRELVNEDIKVAPRVLHDGTGEAPFYSLSEPDENIDYRRIKNLKTFFDRHATSLTCDTGDVAEWQGGDIVCYRGHIGIVSDRRNADGRPYIIHHGSAWQPSYEEDRLDDWGGPIRHWRWDRHEDD